MISLGLPSSLSESHLEGLSAFPSSPFPRCHLPEVSHLLEDVHNSSLNTASKNMKDVNKLSSF